MSGKGQMSKWSELIVAGRPEEKIEIAYYLYVNPTQFIGILGNTVKNGTNMLTIINENSIEPTIHYIVPFGTIILFPNSNDIFCTIMSQQDWELYLREYDDIEHYKKVPKIPINANPTFI